jgi:ubiquinone/menaquinone biosynthesis C-methylase UbiE
MTTTSKAEQLGYEKAVLDHYRQVATTHGLEASSTMQDQITRDKEVQAILKIVAELKHPHSTVLEIGCGNGYLLSRLRELFADLPLTGVDYSTDMIQLAQQRSVPNCQMSQGDVRKLNFTSATFDLVVGERCVINLLEREHQLQAFAEIVRVLKPGGYYICIEAFTDGLEMLNQARAELGLPSNVQPHHNMWFDKEWFTSVTAQYFTQVDLKTFGAPDLIASNFLSSHYFMSRVLYPAITKSEVIYNSLFVQFFATTPPSGNFSPIQLFLLQKNKG